MKSIAPLPNVDEPHVPLPISVLYDAVDGVERLCDELLLGIEAAKQRMWADSRGAAIAELDRLAHRIDAGVRARFEALLNDERPDRPHQAA